MPRLVVSCLIGCLSIALVGCGPKLVPVTGSVKLDGTGVEGATVTFISADGATTASGFTDASGNFSLASNTGPGAFPGDYKVTIVKTPKAAGTETMKMGDDEYMKMMQKDQKENAKKSGAMSTPMPGMKMPNPNSGAASGLKSELPAIYGSLKTSGLSAKVPSEGPITFDLKSK